MILKRRDFLKRGGAGALALPALASGLSVSLTADAAPEGDILVCIFQRGGVDGLNMIVPYGDGDYYGWRPSLAIAPPGEADGAIALDGFFAMHPAMAALKAIYDSGDLAAVHATGSPHDTHSHFDAQDFMERAHLHKGGVFSGWIARHLESAGVHGAPFRAVGMAGAAQKSLTGGSAVVPVAVADIDSFGIDPADPAFTPILEALYGGSDFLDTQAQQALAAEELLSTIVPSQYPPENGAEYPNSDFGQALLQAGQLIKADLLGIEAICVDIGGWDHHNQQATALDSLLGELSAALAAFYTDMGSRMANIVVITQSEFGRRVYENASQGTDHGHGNCMLVMGGGVKGGQVYADWPGLAQTQLYGNGDLQVTIDWRTVLGEMLSKRLLNEALTAVFPDYTMPDFHGIFHVA